MFQVFDTVYNVMVKYTFPLWNDYHNQANTSLNSRVLNLQDLMPDDLRCSWCYNSRNKPCNKCNALESWNYLPHTPSVEKLSSTKPVSFVKNVGSCCINPHNLYVCVCKCVVKIIEIYTSNKLQAYAILYV